MEELSCLEMNSRTVDYSLSRAQCFILYLSGVPCLSNSVEYHISKLGPVSDTIHNQAGYFCVDVCGSNRGSSSQLGAALLPLICMSALSAPAVQIGKNIVPLQHVYECMCN